MNSLRIFQRRHSFIAFYGSFLPLGWYRAPLWGPLWGPPEGVASAPEAPGFWLQAPAPTSASGSARLRLRLSAGFSQAVGLILAWISAGFRLRLDSV